MRWPVFDGGRRTLWVSAIVALVALGLTGLRLFSDARMALSSYLLAFVYWVGLAIGALFLLMIFHASKAIWPVVLRRVIEVLAASLSVAPLLFVPIALGLAHLYPWAGATDALDSEALALLRHRAPYLNQTFFLLRTAAFLGIFIGISRLLLRWSTRQDQAELPALTVYAWKLGAGALPLAGLALTFASVDWLMSLSVRWYSTIWGVYFFAGSFVGAIALVIVVAAILAKGPWLAGAIQPAHWLSIGKFLLAFTCFWAYIAFSQYLLVWIGNLPDTMPFVLLRQNHTWRWVAIALAVGHFLVPFFLLLSRHRKLAPRRLVPIAVWILAMHALDLYWMVMPQVRANGAFPDWSLLTAIVGVGAVMLLTTLVLLRKRHALPVGDPFLQPSLAYSKMR